MQTKNPEKTDKIFLYPINHESVNPKGNTMRDFNDEYEWVNSQNLQKFKGKWIAVINKKIICSGPFADDVVKEVKKKSKETPFLIKVPTEEYLSL
ncbi:MAG: DUF5678 domain-containing protein [Euryarchaeota archaeon]|nr:DUF5678 domain-containing protein [Euryarchaeota archaeon]